MPTVTEAPATRRLEVAAVLDRAAERADSPHLGGRDPDRHTPADLICQAALDLCADWWGANRAFDRPGAVDCLALEAAVEAAADTAATDGGATAPAVLAEWAAPRPARTRAEIAALLRTAAARVRAEAGP